VIRLGGWADGGHKGVVEVHIAANYLTFPCKDGRTALMWACGGGHKEVVEVLIAANANVDIQDKVRGGG